MHVELVRAVDALVLKPVAGVGAGKGAQRQQPRHEAEIGVRFAGPDKLVHLVAWVKWCNAWGEASRIAWTGPGRSAKASPMGTKPSRLRCMASFSHDGRTPPGYWRKSIVCLYSTRTDMRIESTYIWQGDRATVTGDQ